MRIAIISDTHLAAGTSDFAENVRAVLDWAEQVRPDQIVHLGDASAHGAEDPAGYEAVLQAFARAGRPIRWLPGNHDIGEDASTAAATPEPPVSPAALSAWRGAFGPDYWSVRCAGWQLIGLNSQLFGGEDDEEARQWAWLDAALQGGHGKLGVMLHKPLFRESPDETKAHQRYLPPGARATLWAKLTSRDLRFVVAGHTHQFRRTRLDGVEIVWAPSAAYRIPDILQERIGEKLVGAMLLDLTAAEHSLHLVVPPGIVAHDLGEHLDLYPELKAVMAERRR